MPPIEKEPSHSDLLAEMHSLRAEQRLTREQDDKAHSRIDTALDKLGIIIWGRNGAAGGLVRDLVSIKLTVRAIVWLLAVLGSATLVALVKIFFALASKQG